MLNNVDSQFHALYQNLITNGHLKGDRTGHGTLMLPAQMMRFDCTENKLPILSTRFIPTKAFRREMLWFVSGNSSIKYLRDHKVGVWDSWFIPGTDMYDEPVVKYMSVEERLKTKEALAQWEVIDAKLDVLLKSATSSGSAHLELAMPNGQILEYNNLSRDTYVEFGHWLDTIDVPRNQVVNGLPYTFEERVRMANEQGLGKQLDEYVDFEMPRTQAPYPDKFAVVNLIVSTETDPWDLFQGEVDTIQQWLTDKGIPTHRPPAGEKISIQRRLARVSKNDTQKWEEINKALIRDPMVDWDGETYRVTVFKDGKFKDVTLDYGQYVNVSRKLDELKVPAYELLDADIGAGGYGPNWRKWQDTQLVSGLHDGKEVNAYREHGYEWKGSLWDDVAMQIMHREIDQLQNAIDMLKDNPDDRRMLVTAWNPGRTWQAALPPCHLYFQFVSWVKTTAELEAVIRKSDLHGQYLQTTLNDAHADQPDQDNDTWFHQAAYNFCVKNGLITRNLTLFVLLRSSDAPLGLCFNTAQYAYLLHMVGHVVNMDPNELVSVGVDTHLYNNQIPMIEQLLERKDSHPDCDPRVVFNRKVDNIDDFTFEDIDIVNYFSLDKLDIPVAV